MIRCDRACHVPLVHIGIVRRIQFQNIALLLRKEPQELSLALKARPLLETIIRDILGQSIKSLHTDISTLTGERIIVFSLLPP